MDKLILHSDLNNFYASVECLNNPTLRYKPVTIGGSVENRHGIVLEKNNIVKKCGVVTGDVLWKERQKYPDLVFVPPNFDLYLKYSKMARQIYSDYTNKVEAFSIDEYCLNVTESTTLFGNAKTVADTIRIKF